ncbi:MAG: prepilin peptidase [Armatimonadota bacterium]
MPEWLGAVIAFVYGTVVGSFLNVCICRLPEDQSIISPPSHCPRCNTRLKWVDLVPLFSFLLLGRKCRYCGEPISWRYFFVELATGALFAATWLRYGLSVDFFVYAAFMSALIVAFAVDMDLFIIPDQVSIAGVVLGLARDLAYWVGGNLDLLEIPLPWTDRILPVIPSVAGIVVCGGIFYLIAYVSYFAFRPKDPKELENYEGAMGGGDVKLAAAIGAVLGVVPALASFLIAVVLGSVFGVAIVVAKSVGERKGMPWRTEIPFGPYLVAGAVTVILAKPQLVLLWQAWIRFITPG